VTAVELDRLDIRSSQEIFRVLLSTLSHPGQVEELPLRGLGPAIVPFALAGVDSQFAVLGDRCWEEGIERATGGIPADPAQAALVALWAPANPTVLGSLRRGSPLAPEDGAKVGVGCRAVGAGGDAEVSLVLAGPGVCGSLILGVDGLSAAFFEALSEVNSEFPAGIDVWLVDEDDRIAGIPRSTTIEVR
jgi:alpha-D-ribose 1-methylphosphonate 5-triphosphate synthase subunit PhnH